MYWDMSWLLVISRAILPGIPPSQWLTEADSGYDTDWFMDDLQAKGIQICISGRRSPNEPVRYDKRRYRSRSRIEIMFGRQRLTLRCHPLRSLPTAFFAAVDLATCHLLAVINVLTLVAEQEVP
jgi:hypothetical protein